MSSSLCKLFRAFVCCVCYPQGARIRVIRGRVITLLDDVPGQFIVDLREWIELSVLVELTCVRLPPSPVANNRAAKVPLGGVGPSSQATPTR